MSKKILIVVMAACAGQAIAQDSEDFKLLEEVVVQAPKVIRKADMDVYHPSTNAVDKSQNGLQLLGNLMIPSLFVNESMSSIQSGGESVQLRINGRESTVAQIKALLPETIKRVEWIENPGLRYGGAARVLNFIMVNPSLGGSLMTESQQALNTAWGFYMADLKINAKRSQWSAGGNFKLTNKVKTHRNYIETFTYPDGTSLTRRESSKGGVTDNSMADAWASYSYIKPDTTVFMASLSFSDIIDNKVKYDGLLTLSDNSQAIELTESNGWSGITPGLSVYWLQNFKANQMLIVDFKSSFYLGKAYSDYKEQDKELREPLTDVATLIKDRNQVYAAEVDYVKNWQKSKLTAGVSYTAHRNRSEYMNLGGEVFYQHQDKAYLFAEYFQRFGCWSATAGFGVQFTRFSFQESGRSTASWNLRPQASLTYSPSYKHNFQLNFASWQTAPTLAQTNEVAQQIDGFQWLIGNQNLKTSNSYTLTFRYGLYLQRVNGYLGVSAYSSPHEIAPLIFWQDSKLVTTYENSRGLQNLSFFISPQIEIIPEWLITNGTLQYRMQRMKGTGYHLHNNAWSGNASLRLTHWGFTLGMHYIRNQRTLLGEKISWGESFNAVSLGYNWKQWLFTAGMILPFGKYDIGSESLSKWNRNKQRGTLDMRMPYIEIGYNLQWGRQKHGVQKMVDVDANVDSSKTGGR